MFQPVFGDRWLVKEKSKPAARENSMCYLGVLTNLPPEWFRHRSLVENPAKHGSISIGHIYTTGLYTIVSSKFYARCG